jgi:hypothetical protein
MKIDVKKIIVTVFLLHIFILPQCATNSISMDYPTDPIILFWCRHAEILHHLTHAANWVWVGKQEQNTDKKMIHHQDTWLAKNVVPLVWAGGVCYIDESLDDFVERWRVKIEKGACALQIDEYMPQSKMLTLKLVKALEIIKTEYPHIYLAVWHGGFLSEELIAAYKQYVDLLILENYFTDQLYGWLIFSVNTTRVRKANIIHKTIFGLEITEKDWEQQKPYIQEQIKWIRTHASEMRGVGFFAPNAHTQALLGAESLAVHYFKGESNN